MKNTLSIIPSLLQAMGFSMQGEGAALWTKVYPQHAHFVISVDVAKEQIHYDQSRMTLGDRTTSSFNAPENFVVLECVNRLLEKGYKPESITLEHRWKLGHTAKSGKADIVVRARDEKILMIIECKTWGDEFIAEQQQMKRDGGQLFSYFQQDKNVRFLCLYASKYANDGTDSEMMPEVSESQSQYASDAIQAAWLIVDVRDTDAEQRKQERDASTLLTFAHAKTVKELLEVWERKSQKHFLKTGIFEEEIEAYNPAGTPKRIRDLKEFRQEDAPKVFGAFEEILRHNNISDRSNAFNRVISLLLAKIVDEAKSPNEIADFQVKRGADTREELHDRLQSLYVRAMKEYLNEDVSHHTQQELEEIINHFPRQSAKQRLKQVFKELQYYTNNEFAFKEVYNETLFRQNARVLEEVVELFQDYKFRYNNKAQFLGDFFELLLESGYKQSEGQFFTPTPIARFILSSIPFENIIRNKLRAEREQFLPLVLDYACGSGHFITEAMDEIHGILKTLPDESHRRIPAMKQSLSFARECIVGIEKDYRLARTCRVSCFMHGDGDANIIFGDGLAKHSSNVVFTQSHGDFDVVVANPPYSVKDFAHHLEADARDFELLSVLGENSDDIEVLFIERMHQILAVGGYAGIILPSSILSNTDKAYTAARELILRHFEIRALVELSANAFAKTGTNTVVLFLQKRSADFAQDRAFIAEDFILKGIERRADFLDSAALLRDYCAAIDIPFEDYRTLTAREPNRAVREHEIWQNAWREFEKSANWKIFAGKKRFQQSPPEEQKTLKEQEFIRALLEVEKEKFEFFMLTHQQKTLIVKAGTSTEEQKQFLGYEFSDANGYKGIKIKKEANGKHSTMLYDSESNAALNPEKINYYIYRQLLGEELGEIHEQAAPLCTVVNLSDILHFRHVKFEKTIAMAVQERTDTKIPSKWQQYSLGDEKVFRLKIGGTPARIRQEYWRNGTHPWVSIGDMDDNLITATKETINDAAVKNSNVKLVKSGTTLLSFKLSLGKTARAGVDLYTNEAIAAIEILNPDIVCDEYIFAFFSSGIMDLSKTGWKSFGKSLNSETLKRLTIPLPPMDVQQKIIQETDAIVANRAQLLTQGVHPKNLGEVIRQAKADILRKYL